MGILDCARNSVYGAVSRAERTALTLVGDDPVFDQVAALARGTLLVLDVGFVLVPEVFDSCENGVGSSLTETAE